MLNYANRYSIQSIYSTKGAWGNASNSEMVAVFYHAGKDRHTANGGMEVRCITGITKINKYSADKTYSRLHQMNEMSS